MMWGDNEDIAGFRHNQQGGEHMQGVRQNQILGVGQGHSALQVTGAEIETTVVAVVSDFDPMAIPIFFVDNETRTVCHGVPCRSAAYHLAAGSKINKMVADCAIIPRRWGAVKKGNDSRHFFAGKALAKV